MMKWFYLFFAAINFVLVYSFNTQLEPFNLFFGIICSGIFINEVAKS